MCTFEPSRAVSSEWGVLHGGARGGGEGRRRGRAVKSVQKYKLVTHWKTSVKLFRKSALVYRQ